MEGINDIGHSTSADLPEQDVSAEEIIAGMKQIIARVHDRGAKIYGATLTPYEGTTFHGYQPDAENGPRGGPTPGFKGRRFFRRGDRFRSIRGARSRRSDHGFAPITTSATTFTQTTPAIAPWAMLST